MGPIAYTLARLAIVAGLSAASAWLAFRVARRARAAGLALAAIGLAVVLFHYAEPRWHLDRHARFLPGGLWRDALYAPGGFLAGAALALAAGEARQRVLTLLLVVLYAVFALHDPLFVLATAPGNLGPGKLDAEVVLQRNDRNCEAASAATILRLWGVADLSDGEVALRAQTSYYGTTTHRTVAAIRALGGAAGLDALCVETSYDELRAIDHPAILHVKLMNVLPHAVVALKLSATKIRVGDPLVGPQEFEPKIFALWKAWEGEAILVGRDFVHDLGPGDRAPKVRELRPVLGAPAAAGADPEAFDAGLAAKVVEFQAARGLPRTGRLDPKTILAAQAARDSGRIPCLR